MEQLLIKVIMSVCALNTPNDLNNDKKSICMEQILNCSIEYGKDVISSTKVEECITKYKENK